ncbi:MAG: DUF2155 domain-containing protein [Nitrospirae bacterium]|nr:DUF2155 domain-containing protein [Nitrospirota bacterium]MBI5696778.1 DUF2155 domain-containing protein [Nitrospirota bacterium]
MRKYAALALSAIGLCILLGCGGGETAKHDQVKVDVKPKAGKTVKVRPVVELPEDVKGRWKGAVVVIEDKDSNTKKETRVRLGQVYRVPGSDLTVELKSFIPAFTMQGNIISSTSNEPENPAAQVVVMEGGSEIFSGWLFARFPDTHAFSHPRFAITLKEGSPR